jgi:ABC-type oligopeptide transport system ATPase subunit
MPLLEVENLRTYFHTRAGIIRAVDGVSFSLEEGETVGIVGESGSGKSVTCYSMLGLVPQPPGRIESGTARFDGIDLLHCSGEQLRQVRGKRISMIFQDPMTSLNPYLRVSEQIMEPLLVHEKISHREALLKAIEALEEVGIQDAARRIQLYPHQFSGGMRQRVMIAMALISRPEILIADEPTTWVSSLPSVRASTSCTLVESSSQLRPRSYSPCRSILTMLRCSSRFRRCIEREIPFTRFRVRRQIFRMRSKDVPLFRVVLLPKSYVKPARSI